MYFHIVVESYDEYQQTLAHLNEHAEGDWHKVPQAVRDDVVREIEEKLAWDIWADAAKAALKKDTPVKTRKPRQKKKKAVEVEAETLAPESI
jgi:hypothetical protein